MLPLFLSVLLCLGALIPCCAAQENQDISWQLQRQITSSSEEYIFYLKNGDKIKGIKQEEGEDYIKVKQLFGYSGSLTTKVAKADIVKIEPIQKEAVTITEEEIRIKKELSSFHFSRIGAYSFFTDQDYFKITKSIELLQRLYSGFISTFSPLIDTTLNRRIYVIIFGTAEKYYEYVSKVAPQLKNAAGLYDADHNQLVFYDFFNSPDYAMVDGFVKQENEKIRALRDENRRYIDTNYDLYQANLKRIQAYEQSLSAYMSRVALQVKDVNIRVLRHEASHQLTFDLMLSKGGENVDSWILEGLAEFCSTPSIGDKNREHLDACKKVLANNSFIPIKDLIAYSANNQFYTLNESRLALAYAESWTLFYFLMQPVWKEKFFEYFKNARKAPGCLDLESRVNLIEDSFGLPLDELQKRFIAFVNSN